MRVYIFFILVLTRIFSSSLDYADVKAINEKLFASHIIFESFDANIADRSVDKMMESFDPVNFYFYAEDKKEFTNKGAKIVKEY